MEPEDIKILSVWAIWIFIKVKGLSWVDIT
jgi:hypothetical protein